MDFRHFAGVARNALRDTSELTIVPSVEQPTPARDAPLPSIDASEDIERDNRQEPSALVKLAIVQQKLRESRQRIDQGYRNVYREVKKLRKAELEQREVLDIYLNGLERSLQPSINNNGRPAFFRNEAREPQQPSARNSDRSTNKRIQVSDRSFTFGGSIDPLVGAAKSRPRGSEARDYTMRDLDSAVSFVTAPEDFHSSHEEDEPDPEVEQFPHEQLPGLLDEELPKDDDATAEPNDEEPPEHRQVESSPFDQSSHSHERVRVRSELLTLRREDRKNRGHLPARYRDSRDAAEIETRDRMDTAIFSRREAALMAAMPPPKVSASKMKRKWTRRGVARTAAGQRAQRVANRVKN